MDTPSQPRVIFPLATSSVKMRLAMFDGIAKPMPALCPMRE